MSSIPDRSDDGKEQAAELIYKSQEWRERMDSFDHMMQKWPDFGQAAVFNTLRLPIFLF